MDSSTSGGEAPGAEARPAPEAPRGRIVAVGGGKGGIGKSLIAVTFAIELVRRGLRVVLVDCDLGGANLHSFLGMDYPRETLSDFVLRRVSSLGELVVSTPVKGLGLISGARNAIQVANPMYQQKMRLMRALQHIDADAAVLDLGAGTHYNVVDFFLLADHGVLVVVPEPTSVENAYRFLKAAFLRRVKAIDADLGIREILQDVMRSGGQRPSVPAEILRAVAERDPAAGAALEREMATFKPLLVVNQVREPADLTLGSGMCDAARRLFGLDLVYLGHLRHHEQVWRAVRAREPAYFEKTGTPLAVDLAAVVGRLVELPHGSARA
ncbi:MAG TPA: P-loop NTPase [Thermoanaerobaculaceae bacterium]|nr:P-loop NTPase [Thermoanaerobaculaceae bacterium]